MDKLIVVLAGIALSAAVVLWSTDYLSATYTNANSTARAQKWIAEAAQIAIAARQAGSLSLAGDNWQQGNSSGLVAGALVSAYLSDLPRHNGNYVFWPCKVASSNATTTTFSCPVYATDTTHTTDATLLEAKVENANVCNAIQQMANRGSTALPSATVSGTNPITIVYTFPTSTHQTLRVSSGSQFACVNASGTYYFLYRVFLANGS